MHYRVATFTRIHRDRSSASLILPAISCMLEIARAHEYVIDTGEGKNAIESGRLCATRRITMSLNDPPDGADPPVRGTR